jgi:protein arginine kinase activator
MKCQNCGERTANVHLTQIVDNEMTTVHLCEPCAAEKGVDTGPSPGNAPLSDFLAQMGREAESQGDEARCETCGLSLARFKRVGRLGCADCYRSFEQHLRKLFRSLHGNTQHVGKVYLPSDPTEADRTARIASLRRRLQQAVEAEDFERAAQLRDEIREGSGE